MNAKEYLDKKPNRSNRKRVEILERKNWHLTQLLGAILYASEEPETGFSIPERDATSVDVSDVEFKREVDAKGRATLVVRIKSVPETAVAS